MVSGLTNPNQKALEVPPGTVSAAVAAAGTTDPVSGPADLDLKEGTATFVPAVGSLERKNLDLVVVTVDGLHSAPSGVPSGAPSGAPSDTEVPAWLLGGGLVALAGAAALALLGAGGLRRAGPGRRRRGAGRPVDDRLAPPVRVRFPELDVDAAVQAVGVDPRGEMDVPEDVDTVGWYRFGPGAGSGAGSSVLSGHVDDRIQGRGAFYRLSDLAPGDRWR